MPGAPDWPGLEWVAFCENPATAAWTAGCVHEHITTKFLCDEHAVVPDAVGCKACFEAGHECEMTAIGRTAIGPEFATEPLL